MSLTIFEKLIGILKWVLTLTGISPCVLKRVIAIISWSGRVLSAVVKFEIAVLVYVLH